MVPTDDLYVPEYRYKELLNNKRSFRLLKLLPASNEASYIVCEIFEVDALECMPYEALSWTWGSAKEVVTIHIEQDVKLYSFHIPRNLMQALKTLRHHKQSRILWIDAICINQSDPMKKNHQLPLIASIYGKAERVYV